MGEGKNQGGQEGSSKFSQSPWLALMNIKMKPMALVSESLHPLTASLRAPSCRVVTGAPPFQVRIHIPPL